MNKINKSRVKTVAEEKTSNSRYVSEFERSIKEQLSRLPFETISETSDDNIDFRRQITSEAGSYKPQHLRLPPISVERPNKLI